MDCDELYISFLFPPADYVSGITVFKRIVENNHPVDVLQSSFKSDSQLEFNDYVEEYINKRIVVDMDCKVDWTDCIFKFVRNAVKAVNHDYKKIYSRSWLMANHFLACEYKFRNPDVFWTAEFSDPLIYDLSNKPKYYPQMIVDDKDYISKVNMQIKEFNEKNDSDYSFIENGQQAYFIAEYLVYLFADRIIFTNENQRKIMIDQFPQDVRDIATSKSEIIRHPTLDDKFYHISDVDLNLDDDNVNIAYFGNDYYSKRNFESLFYAYEALNHKFKDKIKIHLFISNDKLVKNLLPSDNYTVQKPMGYLDFLNATTKFDVLVVSDVITKGNFEANPYLPSKLSDYMGSKSDIWALYEKGSSLSKFDLRYKSDISNYNDCLLQLVKILDDYGFGDENYTVNEDYLSGRLMALNELYENELRQKNKLNRKVKKLKKENDKIKSSNSWKITKPLRNLKNK